MTQASPVLIVGSARSGTSILWKAIVDGSHDIAGHNEGHFFPVLKRVSDAVQDYYASKHHLLDKSHCMISHLPEAETHHAVLQAVGKLVDQLYEGRRWIEKTPDYKMLEVLPLVLEVW